MKKLDQPVAALFVSPDGHYPTMTGVDAWDEKRDAHRYSGPHPVVAHPPCNLWVNMAAVNWKRYGRQKPAWYPGGNDGCNFAHALACVQAHGGVLEHPAGTHAWAKYNLRKPVPGWSPCGAIECPWGWVCEVWQSAPRYGHQARKRTWLLYVGERPPFELDWTRNPGTHQIGWFDRTKPTLSKKDAILTPPAFARELVKLARWSKG